MTLKYFPQKGGYYLTLVQALWRIGSTWHTLGGLDWLGYSVDPHYNTTSMSQVGCTL